MKSCLVSYFMVGCVRMVLPTVLPLVPMSVHRQLLAPKKKSSSTLGKHAQMLTYRNKEHGRGTTGHILSHTLQTLVNLLELEGNKTRGY